MIKRWRWILGATTRRFFLAVAQVVFMGVFALLFGLAVFEVIQDDPDTIRLNLFVLAFVAQLAVVGFALSRQQHLPWHWREFSDLRHEFAGALILSGLLLFLVTIPAERKAEQQLKRQLFREMGSPDNGIALRAVAELRGHGWLTDGSLKKVNLEYANLQGARLREANLQGADLSDANLQGAYLPEANLQGAILSDANLQEADLLGANLQGAYLPEANLQEADLLGANLAGAYLRYANLQGADLRGAKLQGAILSDTELQEADLWYTNLQGAILSGANLAEADLLGANLAGAILAGANLEGAILLSTNQIRWDASFHEDTILPDGTNWTPDTNITRFTDPNHPDFWRPASGSVWWYPEDSDQGDG